MRALVTSAAVAVIALACFPVVPYDATFTPDETEYLTIGYSWASGSGFVDPVQWHYALDPGPVVPGWAVRPPVVSVLIGIGYFAGATTPFLLEMHVVWTAVVAGLITLVAGRFMRLPAAVGAGLVIGTAPAYVALAPIFLTEVTSVAAFLLVLAAVEQVPRSSRVAALCALVSILAWATRPNYLGLPLAVLVAVVWQQGPAASLRSKGLWTYLGTLVGLFLAVRWIATAAGGYALYEAQARLSTQIDIDEASKLVVESPEALEFLRANAARIGEIVRHRIRDTVGLLLSPGYGRVAWIGLPGILWCLFARPGSVTRRFCALSALGLCLTIFITLAAFDASRYPLLPAVPMALCGFALLDDLARAFARRFAIARIRPVMATAPLAVALFLISTWASPSLANWTDRWPIAPSWAPLEQVGRINRHLVRLCAQTPPDALLATKDPWAVSRLCGNPVLRIPHKLFVGHTPRQFIAERAPRYILVHKAGARPWLRLRHLSRPIAESGPLVLLETNAPASDTNTWHGPGPLRCANQPPDACGRWVPPDGAPLRQRGAPRER